MKKDATTCFQWRHFCRWLLIVPNLKDISDSIPFIHIFFKRARVRLLSAQGQPIKKQCIEQYLRSIALIFASVGAKYPRHKRMGKLDFRPGRQQASYQKEDSPPPRVRPLPVRGTQTLDIESQGTASRNITISNLTWFSFFFLLRPSKYYKGGTNTAHHTFRIKGIQFFIGQQAYNATSASNAVLTQTDFASLMLTTQKNGIKGGSIGHVRASHPQECPVAAMCCRVAYLRCHVATSETPISSFKKGNKWQQIRGEDITAAIRAVFQSGGLSMGSTKAAISAHSLHAREP